MDGGPEHTHDDPTQVEGWWVWIYTWFRLTIKHTHTQIF